MKRRSRKFDPTQERMEVRLGCQVKEAVVNRAKELGVSVARFIEETLERDLGVERWPKVTFNRLDNGVKVVTRVFEDGTIERNYHNMIVTISPEGERSVVHTESGNDPREQALHGKPSESQS